MQEACDVNIAAKLSAPWLIPVWPLTTLYLWDSHQNQSRRRSLLIFPRAKIDEGYLRILWAPLLLAPIRKSGCLESSPGLSEQHWSTRVEGRSVGSARRTQRYLWLPIGWIWMHSSMRALASYYQDSNRRSSHAQPAPFYHCCSPSEWTWRSFFDRCTLQGQIEGSHRHCEKISPCHYSYWAIRAPLGLLIVVLATLCRLWYLWPRNRLCPHLCSAGRERESHWLRFF